MVGLLLPRVLLVLCGYFMTVNFHAISFKERMELGKLVCYVKNVSVVDS